MAAVSPRQYATRLRAATREVDTTIARRHRAAEQALHGACDWVLSPDFTDSPELMRLRLAFEARRRRGDC